MRTRHFLFLLIFALSPATPGFGDQCDSAIGLVTLTTRHSARTGAELRATITGLKPEELQRLQIWSKIVAFAPKPFVVEQRPLAEVFQVRYQKIPAQ